MDNHSYYVFSFSSVEECRKRVFILALTSYQIYGCRKFLPLCEDSFEQFQHIRFEQYGELVPNSLRFEERGGECKGGKVKNEVLGKLSLG